MFIGVVVSVVIILAGLVYIGASDTNAVEKIGEYQNPLLDSYTTAEGSRLYFEKAVKYSSIRAMDLEDYCSLEDIEENEQDFINTVQELLLQEYTDNLPAENMGLLISSPFESTNQLEDICEISSGVIYCSGRNLKVSNCAGELCKALKFTFTTEVSTRFAYNLENSCADKETFKELL